MNANAYTNSRISMLTFSLGSAAYCLPASKVVTIFQKEKTIELPRPRPGIAGLILHQSRLVPLIDLEELLQGRAADRKYIIIVEHSNSWLALLTDHVDSVAEVELGQVHYPLPGECALPQGYVRATVQDEGGARHVLNLEALGNYIQQDQAAGQ